MSNTVIVLGDERVTAAVGKIGKNPVISGLYEAPIKESGIGGTENALKTLTGETKLPKKGITLVLPSSVTTLKTIKVPRMSKKQLIRLVEHEMQVSEAEPVVADYIELVRAKDGSCELLGVSCIKRVFEEYLAMFLRVGITPKCVTAHVTECLQLLLSINELKDKSCIVMIFESSSVMSVLMEKGEYKYSGTIRIFSEPGTVDFATEVTRNVSGILQFQASTRSENTATDVYYAGCSDDDFEVCLSGVSGLGVNVSRLPEPNNFSFPEGESLSNRIDIAGAMLK